MNKLFIYQYVMNIKKSDIYNFGLKQGIKLDDEELALLDNYIKNDFKKIIDNPERILMDAKNKLKVSTYNKLLELYDTYKEKLALLK